MPADREHLNGTDGDSSLPIADINRSDVEAATAEKVKGGETAKTGSQSSGAGTGKASFTPFTISKGIDSSNPY